MESDGFSKIYTEWLAVIKWSPSLLISIEAFDGTWLMSMSLPLSCLLAIRKGLTGIRPVSNSELSIEFSGIPVSGCTIVRLGDCRITLTEI
jgi:hypothetical protein